jgi:hypothetical protein
MEAKLKAIELERGDLLPALLGGLGSVPLFVSG